MACSCCIVVLAAKNVRLGEQAKKSGDEHFRVSKAIQFGETVKGLSADRGLRRSVAGERRSKRKDTFLSKKRSATVRRRFSDR